MIETIKKNIHEINVKIEELKSLAGYEYKVQNIVENFDKYNDDCYINNTEILKEVLENTNIEMKKVIQLIKQEKAEIKKSQTEDIKYFNEKKEYKYYKRILKGYESKDDRKDEYFKHVTVFKIKEFFITSFNNFRFFDPIEYPTIPSVEKA